MDLKGKGLNGEKESPLDVLARYNSRNWVACVDSSNFGLALLRFSVNLSWPIREPI